jgi:hypothetical protein
MVMSFADFDDIYMICCDSEKAGLYEDLHHVNHLYDDIVKDFLLLRTNRWWEEAEKEIKAELEKETVLI